jgi:phage terminase large subunit-like protein
VTRSVCPAYALAHCGADFIYTLTDAERFVMPHLLEVWLRPEQWFPPNAWRSVGFICGRGWGKTYTIAAFINREVEAGRIKSIGLMAPNTDRVDEVQIENLINAAAPWFRPRRTDGTIEWPNGVRAEVFTPEAPGRPRSSNLDFAWLCELVDWSPSTRVEAFDNITTAVRVGLARFVWDTTSKGKNELILSLEAAHRADPDACRIQRGTTFQNPMFSRQYLAAECRKYRGRKYDEEILGRVFAEAAGALWDQDTIDNNRRPARPERPLLTLVAVDPAMSSDSSADEFGIVIGDRGSDGHSYVHTDESGHYTPEEWGQIAVDWCVGGNTKAPHRGGAAGVIVERNHSGDNPSFVIRATARERGVEVITLDAKTKDFPSRRAGVIYVREVVARSSKGARASGPATEYSLGRGHIVGDGMPELEAQMVTFVPGGGGKSPNRYDAHAYLVTELAGLEHDQPGGRAKEDARTAAIVQKEIGERLLEAARGRRIGM